MILPEDSRGRFDEPPNYDVTADGQRALTIRIADSERAPLTIRFIVNWDQELIRRVPVQR